MNMIELISKISLLITFFTFVSCTDPAPVLKHFTVQPGGQKHSISNVRDGITCSFTYQCQGGTNEKWIMVQTKIKEEGTYGCFVEREGGGGSSYIFFQHFNLKIDGQAEVHGGQAFGKGVELGTREFAVSKSEKSISETKNFGSQLSRVTIEYSLLGKVKKEL